MLFSAQISGRRCGGVLLRGYGCVFEKFTGYLFF
jgi:hypothetical protein